MYTRIKKVKEYEYFQIVESRREEGKVKQDVILNLGRVDLLKKSGIADILIEGLAKITEKHALIGDLRNQKPISCHRVGSVLIFERLWRDLGIGDSITAQLQGRHFDFPVERTIFIATLQRLLGSGSDRAGMRWQEDYRLDKQGEISLQHFYRAMAWLGEPLPEDQQRGATPFSPRCQKDLLEERLFRKRRNLLTTLDLVFFDTTSIYFQGQGGETLGQYGHSKDHRPDCHQIVVGMILDNNGRPVCTEIWPGNTADVTTLIPVANRLKTRFSINRVCIVADRGMVSLATLDKLEEMGWQYILGARMHTNKTIREQIVPDASPFQEIVGEREKSTDPSPLKVKEVMLDESRFIVCLNDEQARKNSHDRENIIKKLEESLKKGDKALIGNKGFRTYVKQTDGKHFEIDQEKIASESIFDGKWILTTNMSSQDMTPADIARKYKQLIMVEDIFRQHKSLLDTRPVFHRYDDTIRGHVWLSFLAVSLRKELRDRLEKKRKKDEQRLEWAEIIAGLETLQEAEVEFGNKRFILRSEAKPAAKRCFSACGVSLPQTLRQL
ncbi:MAG: IS1634 family transposase [Planctomycetota bacterium]|jgi:transposase|nr:IS1634 family transposase [Planctomycetota bacterium]